MRILHVNQSDRDGGAAIAARRLVLAQREAGIDAQMLVVRKTGHEQWVHQFGSPFLRSRIRLTRAVTKRLLRTFSRTDPDAMRTLASVRTGLASAAERFSPDLIHWHWVGGEVISVPELAEPELPAAWTCHDHWPFSGVEHYPSAAIPRSGTASANLPDLEAFNRKRKMRAWQDWRPHLICPSMATLEHARSSEIGGRMPASVIGNTIDFDAFPVMARDRARAMLNIDDRRRIVLFGAQFGVADPRKGFDLLLDAIGHMSDAERAGHLLLTFGGRGDRAAVHGMERRSLGFIDDTERLAAAYGAAHVFVNPSRQETFGNTTLEAVACGTPVVAFDTGAASEIIATRDAGSLVRPWDCAAMARAIVRHAGPTDPASRENMRREAFASFSPARIVAKHVELYDRLIRGSD